MQASRGIGAGLAAALGLAACAQILGIDERVVGGHGGASTSSGMGNGHGGASTSSASTSSGMGSGHGGASTSSGMGSGHGGASTSSGMGSGHGGASASSGSGSGGIANDAGADAETDAGSLLDCGADATAVDPENNVDNCGACGHECTYDGGDPNAIAACSNGACSTACIPLYGDCYDAGCSTSLTNDVANCGGCGDICGGGNDAPQCANGACMLNCLAGWADCNNDPADGCEASLTDQATCGGCSLDCGSLACDNAACVLTNSESSIGAAHITMGLLASDAKSLYWASAGNGGEIRTILKTGVGGPVTIFGGGKDGTVPQPGIAVDASWVYYPTSFVSLVPVMANKSLMQAPLYFMMPVDAPAYASGIFLDTDSSANAKQFFFTTDGSSSSGVKGFFRWTIGGSTLENIDGSGAACCMTRTATDVYWAVGNTVNHVAMQAPLNPSPKSLGTVPGTIAGLTTDGVNFYATSSDGRIYTVIGNTVLWTATGCTPDFLTYDPVSTKLLARCQADVWSITTTTPYTAVRIFDAATHQTQTAEGFQGAGNVAYILTGTSVYMVAE